MRALLRFVAIEILFLLLGILGVRIYLPFADSTLIWRSLGTPPDKAVHILDADYMSVRVQTASGGIYYCHFKSPRECWVQNDHPSYFRSTDDEPFAQRTYGQPPELSGVVETRKFYSSLSEYSEVLSIFAVTNKGKVYVWQDGFGTPYDVLVYGFYGIVIALVCGFAIWILYEMGRMLFR